MAETDESNLPEKPPVSLSALGDWRNLVLIGLSSAGAIVFLVLFGKILAALYPQLLTAVNEVFSGFGQIGEASRENQEHLQVYGSRGDIVGGYQLLWTIMIGAGLWGWALIERGYQGADPSVEICLRRAAVLGIGFLIFALVGFDLTFSKSMTAGGALPTPGFGGIWSGDTPNALLQSVTPMLILAALAGYAICGVKSRFLLALACVTTLILFPVIGSWIWGNGWLAQMKQAAPLTYPRDIAGAGVIHLLCGSIGIAMLAGSRWAAGQALPRLHIRSERAPSAILGVILTQFVFVGLIGASVVEPTGPRLAATLFEAAISAAAGAVIMGLARIRIKIRPWPHMLLFGSMGGWVIISGGVGGFELWQAATLGAIAGIVV
ncbi:MAG: hypothetical protein AAF585_08995 [Verrucomicrobiota bacterium]